jgi:hypothetical protein
MAILSTIRAATLLDLYENGPGGGELLVQAKGAAGQAWAIASKTGEVGPIQSVYNRLNKHEAEHASALAQQHQAKAMKNVGRNY